MFTKRWLIALCIAISLLGQSVQPGIAQTDPAGELTTVALASVTVEVGARTTIDGYITCGVPDACYAVVITLAYDPAVLQVDAAHPGPFLGERDHDAEYGVVIDQGAGIARLQLNARNGPTGDLPLFSLAVTGLAAGTTRLTVSSLRVLDSAGNQVAADGVAGIITVKEAPPTAASLDRYSIITGISSHSRQIFLDGLERGNNPHVFENVGDSITYTMAYLRDFTNNYDLGDYAHLQTVLDFFVGPNGIGESPFWSVPIAAYAGWLSDDVLEPGKSPASVCEQTESPLACAYRVNRPAVALIMLGTNDAGTGVPVETFEANMQAIIDFSLDQGVIPVISTIPPAVGRDDVIDVYNRTIRALARANDIPLWDYYAAINDLPDRGLSTDGVHPSRAPDKKDAYFDPEHLQYGFNMRNLGALQVLYELLQQVMWEAE